MGTSFLSLAVRGDLSTFVAAHNKALAQSLTVTVRATANTIRSRVQRQIRKNFHGADKLAKTFVQKNTPKSGYTLTPISRLSSRALYDAKGTRQEEVDLLALYQTAGTVTAASKHWLAVPTKDAPQKSGRGGKRYATPAESGLKFKFLRTADDGKAVLVPSPWRLSGRPPVMYVLLKQTSRQQRIDIDGEVTRAIANLPTFYARRWAALDTKLTDAYGRGLNSSGPILLGD